MLVCRLPKWRWSWFEDISGNLVAVIYKWQILIELFLVRLTARKPSWCQRFLCPRCALFERLNVSYTFLLYAVHSRMKLCVFYLFPRTTFVVRAIDNVLRRITEMEMKFKSDFVLVTMYNRWRNSCAGWLILFLLWQEKFPSPGKTMKEQIFVFKSYTALCQLKLGTRRDFIFDIPRLTFRLVLTLAS